VTKTAFRLDTSRAAQTLRTLADQHRDVSLRELFAADARRHERFSCRHEHLLLDYSKQRIDTQVFSQLLALAEEARLAEGIGALFAGASLNNTEGRAVLHTAARLSPLTPAAARAEISTTTERLQALVRSIHAGERLGSTGHPIRHVVHVGIGGSDLGPRLLQEAFSASLPLKLRVSYAANIDESELRAILADSSPAETLFVLASKSFSTAETLSNARLAQAWLAQNLGADTPLGAHFVAISNNVVAAQAFGLTADNVFPMPEWVGGRFSVWSAIGLPLMLAFGCEVFEQFQAGGRAMDAHFAQAPLERNLPVLLGLLGLWNTSFLEIGTQAILPYSHPLRSLPAYLQQLEMESNGKSVDRDGQAVGWQTAPILFGGAGTVGQHAYHQLFYQGTRSVTLDFIVPVPRQASPAMQGLIGNALAQAAALMQGRTLDEARAELKAKGLGADEVERLAPHLVCPGNQPSNTLLMPEVSPHTAGQLLALYEHKVFVQGWLWGINSFDQYGVELGKNMARSLENESSSPSDSSTAALLAEVRQRWA
jgi:glucose-6-phosphate isomerase